MLSDFPSPPALQIVVKVLASNTVTKWDDLLRYFQHGLGMRFIIMEATVRGCLTR